MILSPLDCLCNRVANQLTICVWICLWTLFCSNGCCVYLYTNMSLHDLYSYNVLDKVLSPIDIVLCSQCGLWSQITYGQILALALLAILCMRAKLLQSCPTLCDPMDCSPSVSCVHGILQARMLE